MNNSEGKKYPDSAINEEIIIRNYKCFGDEGAGFERIMPINVIIGKNNSGKSSLIELIEFINDNNPSSAFLSGRDGKKTEVSVEWRVLKREVIESNYEGNPNLKDAYDNYYYVFLKSGDNINIEESCNGKNAANQRLDSVIRKYALLRVIAERDIKPEIEAKGVLSLQEDGRNATELIRRIITDSTSLVSRDTIEIDLLNDLNLIVKPDIEFTKIEIQTTDSVNPEWEIFFVDKYSKRVILSRMGSGIKTVLLVLLNLIVIPKKRTTEKGFIFAFEELENNLHPALQRRLFQYIKKYSEKHGCYFFLTTHSNVVIDVFGTYEHAQIIHIENDGERSTTRTVLHDKDSKKVLRDLGVKASDLLQSNGVIWVEGPSDRNYLNKWIQLKASDLQEGLHYSIMFYGGRLLANLSFDFEWFNKEVIPLMKINANSFVVMDRDGKEDDAKLNKTKERIKEEIGEGNYWITEGREIENYLSDDVVKNWLKKYKVKADKFSNDKNTKIEDNISAVGKTIKLKYNSSKTVYSSEIAEFIDRDSLDFLDLKDKLDELIKCIREWNE